MTPFSLEKRLATVLQANQHDWGLAAAALVKEAEQDMALLLALTRPFLAGAASHAVQKYCRNKSKAAVQKAVVTKVVAPTLSHRSSPNTMGESMWEALVAQLENNATAQAAPPDLEQHEKALRTVAKAFLSKRLDELAEARQQPVLPKR
jgi:acetylornithine deacetylase/succinyl-diaminopimelate desuccinylase-like protein